MNALTHKPHLLPDTPFFRCRQTSVNPDFERELANALSGGEGSFRVNRYLNYGRIAGDAVSFSTAWLARKTRTTRGEVMKHLRELRALGLLRQNAIDDSYGFVYLTEEARKDRFVECTLDANGYEFIRTYERKDAAALQPEIEDITPVPQEELKKELEASAVAQDDIILKYTKMVRDYNDALPDKEISDALDETEHMLTVISGTVRNMPAQNKKLREVTARYLPQLEKLLKTYQRLYKYGRNSRKADRIRAQIIDAVHLFNRALRQLMEDLLEDAEFDISADIRQMQMMLERDGLLGSAFGKPRQ